MWPIEACDLSAGGSTLCPGRSSAIKSYLPIATLISLALLVVACQPAAEQPDPAAEAAKRAEDLAAIKQIPADWQAAVHAGDAAAIADLFADDAIVMPSNAPAIVGKEAIQSADQPYFDRFTVKQTSDQVEVEIAGDWALDRSTQPAPQVEFCVYSFHA